jgi:hypothetical protein
MQCWGLTGLLVLAAGVAVGLASAGNNTGLPTQNHIPSGWPAFELGSVTHETHTESQTALPLPNVSEIPGQVETGLPRGSVSTRSSFFASWEKANSASGYLLDVSMDSSFRSYLDGYHNLDVGLVTGRVVTGLDSGTTYYYRVRPYGASGTDNYSEVNSATTVATTGLTIHATFDNSITSNPNAAAIEAMINRCISIYESLFSDPITIQILFRYATTAPDGHLLRPGATARSDNPLYILPWNVYVAALRADARTGYDSLANATLPGTALSATIRPSSANGRAVGLDTPPAMFADGTVGDGGPYDGIVTLNSGAPFQFTRPTPLNNFDAQRETEHEIDEVMGLGSAASVSYFHPQDLFSWSSAGVRNITSNGTRYFSINGGVTNIVNFNQNADEDLGDWLSGTCPQTHPYVQNASDCLGQPSDIAATSPEGIDLDVLGYDLVGAPPPVSGDFNNDGHPDYLLFNPTTRGTVIWYMNNSVHVGGASGPILPAGWQVIAVADFNRDGHPDYLLFNPTTRGTVIWYMNNNVHVAGASGPTLPVGWQVIAVADFNRDGHPDYLLFNPTTRDTVIWYMNNNVQVTGAHGPTLPVGWSVVAVADFNGDGHPDYLLFNPTTLGTVIWYMDNNVHVTGDAGPTLPFGWSLVGAADFNGNGKPDYLLFNPSTRHTVIWYMNNNVHVTGVSGPTLPAGWNLVAP